MCRTKQSLFCPTYKYNTSLTTWVLVLARQKYEEKHCFFPTPLTKNGDSRKFCRVCHFCFWLNLVLLGWLHFIFVLVCEVSLFWTISLASDPVKVMVSRW